MLKQANVYVLQLGKARAVVIALNENQARQFVMADNNHQRQRWIKEATCERLIPGVFGFGTVAIEG
jgi:hypothetical protein